VGLGLAVELAALPALMLASSLLGPINLVNVVGSPPNIGDGRIEYNFQIHRRRTSCFVGGWGGANSYLYDSW